MTYRLVTDHLGSPRLVVDVSTGSVVQRTDYLTHHHPPKRPRVAVWPSGGGFGQPAGDATASGGGRRVRADRAAARGWHPVAWPAQRMTAEVPAGWEVRDADRELQVRFGGDPPAFLLGHASPALPGVGVEQLLAIHRASAAEHLAQDLIDGWIAMRLGAVAGVMTVERRGDGDRMLVWNGVRATPHGAATVTLLVGVGGAGFDAHEPVLGAVLASVRFAE